MKSSESRMSVKHYPYVGGSFDMIVFDGDGSIWVPERTCKLVKEHFESSGASYRLVCSECHHTVWDGWQEKPRFCAFCGARVEGR